MPKNKKKSLKKIVRKVIAKNRLRGRGGYWQDFQKWTHGPGKWLMEGGSRALGAQFGWGAEYLSRVGRGILGLGKYRMSNSSLQASPVPAMHSTMDAGIRICHHEYLGEISSSTAFSCTTFPVNVGLNSTFPWLASLSGSFQYYRFNGLMFVFRTTSSWALNSTNTALGCVMGAAQYNVNQAAPTDKTAFINLAGATSAPPNVSQMFPIECKKMMTSVNALKVRTSAPSDDLQFYDLCNFSVATFGSQATAVVGELWVTYDVTLMHAQPASLSNDNMSAHIYGTTASGSSPFGTTSKKFDSVGVTLSGTTNVGTLTLPAGLGGRWLVNYVINGNAATIAAPAITFTNATAIGMWNGTAGAISSPGTGISSTVFMQNCGFTVTDPTKAASIIFTATNNGLPSSATVDLVLTELNPSLISKPYQFGVQVEEVADDDRKELSDTKEEGVIVPTPISLTRVTKRF